MFNNLDTLFDCLLPISNNNIKSKKIINLIKKDKKNNNGEINLVLIKRIGKAYYLRNINQEQITKILN